MKCWLHCNWWCHLQWCCSSRTSYIHQSRQHWIQHCCLTSTLFWTYHQPWARMFLATNKVSGGEMEMEVNHDDTEDQLQNDLLHKRKYGWVHTLHIVRFWIVQALQLTDWFEEKVRKILPDAAVVNYLICKITLWHADGYANGRAFLQWERLQHFVFTAI